MKGNVETNAAQETKRRKRAKEKVGKKKKTRRGCIFILKCDIYGGASRRGAAGPRRNR